MANIGAVILAAGGSSRFGRPKQLIQFRGRSLLRRIVDAASAAGCSPIVVVVGSDQQRIKSELAEIEKESARRMRAGPTGWKPAPRTIENKNWKRGIGGSIRRGVRELIDKSPKIEAVVLLVCDQPFVDANVIKRLISRREESQKPIVASSYADTLGVPALFERSCFQELLALGGETAPANYKEKFVSARSPKPAREPPVRLSLRAGSALPRKESGAKSIILMNRDRVAVVSFPEGRIDIDTAADYERLVRDE
jgi:molybdenum cofactor cytidylyltransferase